MLSAQQRDANVNAVTPPLFEEASTPHAMVRIGAKRVEELIKPLGLAGFKSKNIIEMCTLLLEEHGGEVPTTADELEALPGVGPKTAAVVLSDWFSQRTFLVDSHILRLAGRWGIRDGRSVWQTEVSLRIWFAHMPDWGSLCQRIVLFGRRVCKRRGHRIPDCPICKFAATNEVRDAEWGGIWPPRAKHRAPYTMFSAADARKMRTRLRQKARATIKK